MNQWWVLFVLIKYSFVNGDDYLCNYVVNKSDNTLDKCISNECNKFVDPYSIMVEPNNCKTKNLSLAFSSYQNFSLFLNRIKWKLGDLFPSKLNNQIRQLTIFIFHIDSDDQPLDHHQLSRLGINIDLYQLYLQNITKKYSFYELIHYDPINSEWDIIKVQIICNPLMRFDQNPCSTQIISPVMFAPRRPPPFTTEIIPLLTTSQLSSSSSTSTEKQNQKSNHLIIIILIPLIILLITIIISIFVYIYLVRNRCSNMDLRSTTPRSSSIPSISHNVDTKTGSYSEYRGNAIPYQISRLPSPHKDSLYKEVQRNF